MAEYNHQSGAQKRKKKRDENLKIQKLPKISRFFFAPSVIGESSDSEIPVAEKNISKASPESLFSTTEHGASEHECNVPPSQHLLEDQISIEEGCIECEDDSQKGLNEPGEPSTSCPESAEPSISTAINIDVVGPYPRDNDAEQRCFSQNYYERVTKTGLKLPVIWLCYSPKLNCAYCEPCWLFGDCKKQGFEPAWAKGIQNWKGLSKKISVHESSLAHIEECVVYDRWRSQDTIDKENERQIIREKDFWRQVLKRIINTNSGNFLATIELLAQYDTVLKELLQKPQGTIKYLSPKVQNEVIEILSNHVLKNIISDVEQAQFYSVIMDTTQDISKVDQLSQVIRYVVVERDECMRITQVNIQEAFLGFHAIKDQSAAGIENEIVACIERNEVDISKCRGQGYDGAATMSGIYSGVQARILQREENALYVHCAAHNLNLVLQDAVSDINDDFLLLLM
ncbi:hypothetical protein XELAEV_18006420mg [Xenopus laevis]|uniref:DUF4371 domain-containing protein n=1 Tax=Xenopus laevis TaxID=8355 RepID=A0A974E153_XENLA|nr:hypothetical protein XELAEV_18006420mg [Xenopus laevis]